MKKRIISYLLTFPKTSLTLGIFLVLLISSGIRYLHFDFSYRIWFLESNPKLKLFDRFEKTFGNDETGLIFVHSKNGIFRAEAIQVIHELTDDLWKAPEVIRVDSIVNYNYIYALEDEIFIEPFININKTKDLKYLENRFSVSTTDPVMKNYLINEKGDTAAIYVSLKPNIGGTPDYELIVKGLRSVLKKYEKYNDFEFYLNGSAPMNYAFREASDHDIETLVPFVLLITLLFLWLSLRSVSGVILATVVISSVVISTLGSSGWLNITFNNITGIVTQILIAITLSVSVHLLVTFHQFLGKGLSKLEALKLTLEKNLGPTFFTSMTTMIGFFSFTASDIPPISSLGVLAGIGTAFSWIFGYLILMPLLYLLPIKANHKVLKNEKLEASPRAIKFIQFLSQYKKIILLFSGVIAVVFFYLTLKVEVNSDPNDYFSEDYSLSQSTKFGEEHIGSVTMLEILIDTHKEEGVKEHGFLVKLDELNQWLNQSEFVNKTVSIIDIFKKMNQVLNQNKEDQYQISQENLVLAQQLFMYSMNLPQGMDLNNRISVKNDATRVTVMVNIHDSTTISQMVESINNKMKELQLDGFVTGKFYLYSSLNDHVVSSFLFSISLAIVFIGIIMIIWLRSFKLGILSLLPNAFPLVIGGAVVEMFGKNLNIGTMVIGSICFGIAVDDTIHFLANFNKHKNEGLTAQESVAKVMTYTAPSLIITTVVLVFSFSVFVLAQFVPNRDFGLFTSLILSFALLADLVLLPTLLLVLEKKKR